MSSNPFIKGYQNPKIGVDLLNSEIENGGKFETKAVSLIKKCAEL